MPLIRPRSLALFFIFSALFTAPAFSAEPALLEITVLDTGYADAILIQSPEGQNVLLDSGDVTKPDLVADFLKSKKIDRLDLVIISHPHKNHFGALFRVLDEVAIKEIVWNGEPKPEEPFSDLLKKIQEKKIPLRIVVAGDRLELSKNFVFDVLSPFKKMTDNLNDNALVLKMSFHKASALFTTDIGYGVQNALIKKYKKKLVSDIVQVPHHGGPISENFVKFFKADFFILSTGPSDWPAPREAEIAKLKGQVLRTDKDGTLFFQSDGNKIWQK